VIYTSGHPDTVLTSCYPEIAISDVVESRASKAPLLQVEVTLPEVHAEVLQIPVQVAIAAWVPGRGTPKLQVLIIFITSVFAGIFICQNSNPCVFLNVADVPFMIQRLVTSGVVT
jgi:hypothetical protein